MDEGYFLYFEEVDFCLRAHRAGWPCWYVPQSRIMHIGGQSTGVADRETANEDELNHILWRAAKGPGVPYPAPVHRAVFTR